MQNTDNAPTTITPILEKFYREFKDFDAIFRYGDTLAHMLVASKEYAQLYMRQLVVLNGGALVAVPTIIELFGNGATKSTVDTAMWFICGLISIAVCILLAYFSVTRSILAAAALRTDHFTTYLSRHIRDSNPNADTKELITAAATANQQHTKHQLECENLEGLAVISALISLVCFIGGCYKFANTIKL
ncbi:MAG: hypothetical protein AB7G06_05805 [Bdellovibrionales bacterium]